MIFNIWSVFAMLFVIHDTTTAQLITAENMPAENASVTGLRQSFLTPPAAARPWVYWMWVNGNISKAGVTADLEAMKRVGIGGALALDVDQGTPSGHVTYMDSNWQAIFKHSAQEAKRLGMEITTNNGAGYWGSGGPWIKPEMGMQWVVSSETIIPGNGTYTGILPKPGNNSDYSDIAVIAIGIVDTAANKRFLIPDFALKSDQWPGNAGSVNYAGAPMTFKSIGWPGHPRYLAYRGTTSAPQDAVAPQAAIIPKEKVTDISDKMMADGSIVWEAPPGEWTIIRLGNQFTGSSIGPVVNESLGPESDKLSKEATRFHFDAIVKKLKMVAGTQGSTGFVGTHIDSWEGGGQNWTPKMREEFLKRRGYDIIPFLPILTGRVIESLQYTERFLWDLRKTVSELTTENYVAEFQRLCKENGLRFTFEAYTTLGNDLDAANYVDEPMAEFWTPSNWSPAFNATGKSMSSAAHLNGRAIVSAEAMTSSDSEKWLLHPASVKYLADQAFCRGINRFVFHRYTAQNFPNATPGIQMGPWGLHYERTNTWWEMSGPWHQYLSRCQYMLRQGSFVSDILALQPEEPLYRFQEKNISGYDYDACGTDIFKKIMALLHE